MDKKVIQSVWSAYQEVQKEQSMKKESEESPYPSLDKKKREKKGSNLEPAGGPSDKLKGESVDVEEGEVPPELKKNAAKMKKGTLPGQKNDKDGAKDDDHSSVKEDLSASLFTAEELAGLEEKMKQPNDDASAGEPFMSTNSEGEKKFAADHKKSDKKFEDMEDQSEQDAADAGRGVKSQSPTRRGEKRVGDNAMPTPTKAKGQ